MEVLVSKDKQFIFDVIEKGDPVKGRKGQSDIVK